MEAAAQTRTGRGRIPWCTDSIAQTRGIRQGSVVSPFIFAVAIECAFHSSQRAKEWPTTLSSAPDMQVSSLLFMDDSILWGSRREALERKYAIFSRDLKPWGLTMNPKKTAFYSSPHSITPPQICPDGYVIQSSASCEVMGIKFAIPFKPAAIMDTGMAIARKKYLASVGVLECRRPVKKRLQVFQSTGLPCGMRQQRHPMSKSWEPWDGGQNVRTQAQNCRELA